MLLLLIGECRRAKPGDTPQKGMNRAKKKSTNTPKPPASQPTYRPQWQGNAPAIPQEGGESGWKDRELGLTDASSVCQAASAFFFSPRDLPDSRPCVMLSI